MHHIRDAEEAGEKPKLTYLLHGCMVPNHLRRCLRQFCAWSEPHLKLSCNSRERHHSMRMLTLLRHNDCHQVRAQAVAVEVHLVHRRAVGRIDGLQARHTHILALRHMFHVRL